MKKFILTTLIIASGCAPTGPGLGSERVVPAEEFSKSFKSGKAEDFSIYRVAHKAEAKAAAEQHALSVPESGDPRYLNRGYALKKSMTVPGATIPEAELRQVSDPVPEPAAAPLPSAGNPAAAPMPAPRLALNDPAAAAAYYRPVGPPPGSSSPYFNGQMTANPSLWPDEGQGASLFRDFRAFQAMDVLTIIINDNTQGKRKADTDAKGEFSLMAGIKNFFGIETSKWESNNPGLDAENMINATVKTDFKGEGETKREGTLKARLSAVILEVLPNGLMRVEGTKIIAVNSEEEVMVISGLVRQRDVDSNNQVDSSRIANLRVDLYGRGVLGDQQQPGWGSRLFEAIWPF